MSHTDAPNQLSIPLGWAEADRPELTFLNNKGAEAAGMFFVFFLFCFFNLRLLLTAEKSKRTP